MKLTGCNNAATLIIIFINSVVFLLQFLFSYDFFLDYFGLNIMFFNGFYWQIFTTMFIHADFFHLAMNMAVLYYFGSIIQRILTTFEFVVFYIFAGVLISFLSSFYIFFNNYVVIVGSSGIISSLMGIYAAIDKTQAKNIFIYLVLVSFIPILVGINIAWYGHIIGFIVGFLYIKLRFR